IRNVTLTMPLLFFRSAAAFCFLAVALGAFGAHSLRSTLETHGMLDVWNKAVLYHFIHALALFVLALFGAANRGAWWLLFAGIFLFSGSLYLMALIRQSPDWLGPITPLGGLCFLVGWAWLIIAPSKLYPCDVVGHRPRIFLPAREYMSICRILLCVSSYLTHLS